MLGRFESFQAHFSITFSQKFNTCFKENGVALFIRLIRSILWLAVIKSSQYDIVLLFEQVWRIKRLTHFGDGQASETVLNESIEGLRGDELSYEGIA